MCQYVAVDGFTQKYASDSIAEIALHKDSIIEHPPKRHHEDYGIAMLNTIPNLEVWQLLTERWFCILLVVMDLLFYNSCLASHGLIDVLAKR